jgi:hypothetical protein
LYLKRRIAELNRVRAKMRLDIITMKSQPGYPTQDEFAETVDSLFAIEDELLELVRQYEGVKSLRDPRD